VNTQRGNPAQNARGAAALRRWLGLIALIVMSTLVSPAWAAPSNLIDATKQSSTPPPDYGLSLPRLYLQTMNNCGPATLSMVFAYYGVDQSQQAIGSILRPFQDPTGNNDDKSVFMDEMTAYAESSGFATFHRVNGDLDTLRALVSHNLPVVVQTLLDPNGDIGHFRIVTGYSDAQQRIVQTDPYRGANLGYSYSDFLGMWQPYGYEYLVIVPVDKAPLVTGILGDKSTEAAAWQGLLDRSKQEEAADGARSPYPLFNEAKAYYHLGRYPEAKAAYESVASQLPPRTLWYQLEPLQMYQQLGEDAKVLAMTEQILNRGNRAFPEVYYIQAQVYIREGNIPAAKARLGLALYYNRNYRPAGDLLKSLGS
jgi:tetratricopeptide (TPR) repeat protein